MNPDGGVVTTLVNDVTVDVDFVVESTATGGDEMTNGMDDEEVWDEDEVVWSWLELVGRHMLTRLLALVDIY